MTQIIENYDNDRDLLANDTVNEIQRINKYENRWKIMSNLTKLNIVSISKTRPTQIVIDNGQTTFANKMKILGRKLRRTGIISHITDRISSAKQQTQK